MLGMALHGAQATLPQHVPQHEGDLLTRAKEAAESTVLLSICANFLGRPAHDVPGISKKHVCLHLLVLIVACIVIAHVV